MIGTTRSRSLAGAAAVIITLGVVGLWIHAKRQAPAPAAVTVALPPPASVTPPPVKAVPQPAIMVAATPPKPAPPAPASPPPVLATPKPSIPVLPALPQVQVASRPEHNVPEIPNTARATRSLYSVYEGPSSIPDTSPSYRSLSPAYRPAPEPEASAVPHQFSGRARVTGPTSLIVAGVPVELFGIKRPAPTNRCNGGDCASQAQNLLLSHIAQSSQISCRRMHATLGIVVFAACLDGQGVDLAGSLIGDGLARADARQSYDYVGAEHVARDLKRGLWADR